MTTLEGVNPQMIANNLKPFQPTHPGEVLKDELEYRGISQRGLAKQIGSPRSRCRPIACHAKRIRHADGRARRDVYGEAQTNSPHCRHLLVL